SEHQATAAAFVSTSLLPRTGLVHRPEDDRPAVVERTPHRPARGQHANAHVFGSLLSGWQVWRCGDGRSVDPIFPGAAQPTPGAVLGPGQLQLRHQPGRDVRISPQSAIRVPVTDFLAGPD